MTVRTSVELNINAPADRAWELVADVTRMGEWSPETTSARWLRGSVGPHVNARFRGRNRFGWRRWVTRCEVTACEPGRVFAFQVRPFPLPVIAWWEYRFVPTADGCCVIETVEDRRGRVLAWIGDKVGGVPDRALHNKANMVETLRRLAEAALESAGP